MILDSVLEHVGNTPMVRADRLAKEYGLKCNLYCKCEYFNAGGSVKDRIAKRMIAQAERDGRLIRGKSTIIEPTSGNTGIGLALQAAVLGYRCIICLPEKMSKEKVTTLKALGAEVIRTPTEAGPDDPRSHIQVAQRLAKEIPYGIVLDQYANIANPEAHYHGTGVEIAEDIKATVHKSGHSNGVTTKTLDKLVDACSITSGLPTTTEANGHAQVNGNGHTQYSGNGMNGMSNGHSETDGLNTPKPEEAHEARESSGQVDLLVAGAGTGGSISGISKRLKEEWPGEGGAKVLGVDPVGSLLALPATLNDLKEGESSFYAVEGIGYDFVPEVLDRSLIDKWVKINDEKAFAMARKLIRTEGLLVGGSSGCAMAGAIAYLTQDEEGKKIGQTPGKNVVVIMPDSIRNYISKPWLLEPQSGDEAPLAQ